jgi:ABC-type glutathione transport system ATPase component
MNERVDRHGDGHGDRRGDKHMDKHMDGHGDELLRVANLRIVYRVPGGAVPAVDGVSFTLRKGETVGIVGESG